MFTSQVTDDDVHHEQRWIAFAAPRDIFSLKALPAQFFSIQTFACSSKSLAIHQATKRLPLCLSLFSSIRQQTFQLSFPVAQRRDLIKRLIMYQMQQHIFC